MRILEPLVEGFLPRRLPSLLDPTSGAGTRECHIASAGGITTCVAWFTFAKVKDPGGVYCYAKRARVKGVPAQLGRVHVGRGGSSLTVPKCVVASRDWGPLIDQHSFSACSRRRERASVTGSRTFQARDTVVSGTIKGTPRGSISSFHAHVPGKPLPRDQGTVPYPVRSIRCRPPQRARLNDVLSQSLG